jgi:hypothetical protein
MKTNYLKMNWVIASLVLAVLGIGYLGTRSYFKQRQLLLSMQAGCAALDRLALAQQLGVILKRIDASDTTGAARQINSLMRRDLEGLNTQLASADDGTREFAQHNFNRISAFWPRTAVELAGSENAEN